MTVEYMQRRLIIEVKNVSKSYGTLIALKDVNFKIYEGELVSIIGPNGCGKSTLIQLLSKLLKPTSGEIVFFNKNTNKSMSAGVVFQDYRKSLFGWRTIRENVEVPLEIEGISPVERRKRVDKYLNLLKLKKFENCYPSELSGGLQQKVAIARALIYNPDILLLDEPFASLDPQTRQEMQIGLMRIWRITKKTTVLVTHSIDEAIYISNRIVTMTKSPGKVKKTIKVRFRYPRNPKIVLKGSFMKLKSSLWGLMEEGVHEA